MNCPKCQSNDLRKNGRVKGKQRYVCKSCNSSFVEPELEPESLTIESSLEVNSEPNRSELSGLEITALESNKDMNEERLIQELHKISAELKSELVELKSQQQGEPIAILLLDAENIFLEKRTEDFLAHICTYPIQIKIAFANWRRLHNADEEFYNRNYQMIHVPGGRDSADAKMTAVGASIFFQYPQVKEVLICSSDWGLTHLYNHLQTYGLKTYLVREDKENKQITVLDSKTEKTQLYSLVSGRRIPTMEDFVTQLAELMEAEQNLTKNPWVKYAKVSNLYLKKYGLKISDVVSTYYPDKTPKNFFAGHPMFDMYQPKDQSEPFVTVLEAGTIQREYPIPAPEVSVSFTQTTINSQADLETAIAEIIQSVDKGDKQGFVKISSIGTEFQQRYNQTITETLKIFGLTGNLAKFLQSRPEIFKFKQASNPNQNQVALVSPPAS